MLTRQVRCLARLGIAGAMVLLLTGCPEDAADIVEVKATSLDFDVAPLPLVSFSTGAVSVDRMVLADFDASVSDAFGRSSEPFSEEADAYPLFYAGFGWAMGSDEGTRPMATADDDPRKPLLTLPAASLESDFLDITEGYWSDPGDYDFYGQFCCATPGATYVVGLERLALQVNAELDAEAVMLGQPVTAPDSLFRLGGAPGGDYTRAADLWNTGNPYPAETNANPFIFGYVSASGTGTVTLDAVVSATDAGGATIWMLDIDDANQDLAVVAPNQLVGFDFPNYNYLTYWETNPDGSPDYSRPLARYQMGVDLDANGDPINNALAPFPDAAVSPEELIGAPGGAGAPDSITVDILKAEPMAGSAVWQAWLVNRDEEPVTAVPATATYQRVAIVRKIHEVTGEIISEKDSVLDAIPQTSNFQGELIADLGGDVGEQEIKHRLIISDATVGGGSGPGFFTDVVVTLEESAGATTPSDAMAVWYQYTDQAGTPTNYFDDTSAGGTIMFGHFDPDDPTASTTFTEADIAQASGVGGVVEVTHDSVEVSVEMKNLPLPPVGYYYEGWLVGPNGNTLSLGPIRALPPDTTSLFHADTATTLPSVTPTGIRYAVARGMLGLDAIMSEDGGEFTVNLTNFYLTLEPKVGAAPKNIADLEVGLLPTEAMIRRMGG